MALAAALAASSTAYSQDNGRNAIDELVDIMNESPSVQARKVVELPFGVRGKLIAIAEFDEENESWQPMDGRQDFGTATQDRISVLGYEVGHDGFVEAHYVDLDDRRVVSYTGLTTDRRLSVNLYDDPNDAEHLVLQIRVGSRQLRYLLLRPAADG